MELLNEVLSKITDKEDYQLNPKSLMVDKNGTYYWGIKEVFELEFVASNIVSCQIHFKNDVNKALARPGCSFRQEFKKNMH